MLGGRFESECISRVWFMIFLCRHSDLPFSADVYGAVVWWCMPLLRKYCAKDPDVYSPPLSVQNSLTFLPVSFLTRDFHSRKTPKASDFFLSSSHFSHIFMLQAYFHMCQSGTYSVPANLGRDICFS